MSHSTGDVVTIQRAYVVQNRAVIHEKLTKWDVGGYASLAHRRCLLANGSWGLVSCGVVGTEEMTMILEMVIDAESGAICDLLDSIEIHIPCVV